MLLFGVTIVSLIWMWWTERRPHGADETRGSRFSTA